MIGVYVLHPGSGSSVDCSAHKLLNKTTRSLFGNVSAEFDADSCKK
jgi:hypothetical protein